MKKNSTAVSKKIKSSGFDHLRRLLQPVLAVLKRRHPNTNQVVPSTSKWCCSTDEINDNVANETLENFIFEEIDCADDHLGVPVYYGDGTVEVVPIVRGQRYVPVHFAKTEAGTFFWTTTYAPDSDINSYGDHNSITTHQVPELQQTVVVPDRWAQA